MVLRKVTIRHPDGRVEERTESIDPNRLFLGTVDSIPEEHRGRLNMTGAGDALVCPWSNPAVALHDALLRVSRGFMVNTGFPLRQICCSRTVFDGMVLRSDEIRRWFHVGGICNWGLLVRRVDRANLPDGAQAYVIGNLSWVEWLVDYDPIYEAARRLPDYGLRGMNSDGVLFSASCYDLTLVGSPHDDWRGPHASIPAALAASSVRGGPDGLISPVVPWLRAVLPTVKPEPVVPAGWRL